MSADAIPCVPSQFEVVHTPPPILSFRVQNPLTVPYGDLARTPFHGGDPGVYALKWQGDPSAEPDLRRFLHGKPGGFRNHAFGIFDGILKLGTWDAEKDVQEASITLGTEMPVRLHNIIFSGTERANTDTYGAIPLYVELSFGEEEFYTPLIWEIISNFSLVYRHFDVLAILSHEMQTRMRLGYPTQSILFSISPPSCLPMSPPMVQASFPLFTKIPTPPRHLHKRPYWSEPLLTHHVHTTDGEDDGIDDSDVALCDDDEPNLRILEPQFPHVAARNLFDFEVPLAGIFYGSLNEKAQEDILGPRGILNVTS